MPFDQSRADRAVNFFEGLLTHTKGRFARKPFVLPWWQKKIVTDVFGTVRRDGLRQYRTVYLEVPKKNGKALALDTPVPTPEGWSTMGQLQVGDVIFDDRGLPCRVTFTTPVMHGRPCFRVSFTDGESIIADAEHLWLTRSRKPEAKLAVRTTAQIRDSLRINSPGSCGSNHSLHLAKAIQTEWVDLPIHPYVLGAWLGDGSSANASITCARLEQDLIENIRACGVTVDFQKVGSKNAESTVSGLLGKRPRGERKGLSVQEKLRSLGVLGSKHIPSIYLRASVQQRTALLQGLMDTDGYCSKAGQCEFTTISIVLCVGFLELVWSLGLKATCSVGIASVNGKDCGLKYRIQFFPFQDFPVFRLQRKLARQKARPKKRARSESRQICAVDPVESVPVRCIQVDSPSSLFLVGRTFVPTHNTELAAGFANKLLFDDDEPGAEVYSAASTRDQAGICFRAARSMVRQCDALNERCQVVDSTKVIYLKDDPNSFYKAISADADVQDGINPSGAVYDELHRLKHRDLWDVLEYGTATRDQPLIIVITTAGVVGESPICEEMHDKAVQVLKGTFKDPTFYAVIYGLDKDDDWTFEGEPAKFDRTGTKIVKAATGWYKANPALGDFMNVEAVRKEVSDAKQIASKQSSLRRFRFNQWVNAASTWIPSEQWSACGEPFNPDELTGKTCYGGLDLSSTIDVTALVLVFPMPDNEIWLLPEFWLPEDDLAERVRRDMVPYDVWAKQGLIKLTPGNVVDYSFIRQRIKEVHTLYNLIDLGHDPWNATQLVTELTEEDGIVMVPIRQGFASLSAPSKSFEKAVLGRRIRHNGNPVLKWMMDCCSVKSDAAGNIKPVKPDRAKSSKRIDGIVASILGLDRLDRHEGVSVYEERGIRTV